MRITCVCVGYSRLVTGEGFTNKKHSLELTADCEDDEYTTVLNDLERKCENYVESKLAGSDVIVITKEQGEKIKSLVQSIYNLKSDELPF
jgi:hypothetical protein